MNSIYELKIFTSGRAQFSMNVTIEKGKKKDLIVLINNSDWDLFQQSIFVDSKEINVESVSKLVKNDEDDLVSAVISLRNTSKSDLNATLMYMKNYTPWNPHYKIKMPLNISRYSADSKEDVNRNIDYENSFELELWGSFKNDEKIPLKSIKIILIYDVDNKIKEINKSRTYGYRGVQYEESLAYTSRKKRKKSRASVRTMKVTEYIVNSEKTLDPGEILSVPLYSQKWPFKLVNYFKFKFNDLNTTMESTIGDIKGLRLYRKISSKSAIFSIETAEIPGKSLVFDKSGNYLTNYYIDSGSTNYHIMSYSEDSSLLCSRSIEISKSFDNYKIITPHKKETKSNEDNIYMEQTPNDSISKDSTKKIVEYYNENGNITIKSTFFDIIKTSYNLINKPRENSEDNRDAEKSSRQERKTYLNKKKRKIIQNNKIQNSAIVVHNKSHLYRIYKYDGNFRYYIKNNGDIIILTKTSNKDKIVITERKKREHVIKIDKRNIDSLYKNGFIEKNLMLELKEKTKLHK